MTSVVFIILGQVWNEVTQVANQNDEQIGHEDVVFIIYGQVLRIDFVHHSDLRIA